MTEGLEQGCRLIHRRDLDPQLGKPRNKRMPKVKGLHDLPQQLPT